MRIQIRQMVHANICVRDMERSVPFYEMLGFEKFADQIFARASRAVPDPARDSARGPAAAAGARGRTRRREDDAFRVPSQPPECAEG